MSAVTQTNTVARVGASTPAGKTQWVERRASRLAVAFSLTQQAAIQEAEKDYWAFRGVGGLCDQCDHTFFCSRPGCINLTVSAPAKPVARAVTTPRSCDALGLCQGRTPCCTGCTSALAAPVADFISDGQISALMRWALVLAAGTSLVALVLWVVGRPS